MATKKSAPAAEPNRFDAEMRVKYEGKTLAELASAMHAIQHQAALADLRLKELAAEYDWLRISYLPSQMEAENMEVFKVTGIGRVQLTGDIHCNVESGKGPELIEWLREHGLSDIIKDNVNSSTLKATIKELIQQGKAVPPMVKIHAFTRASITKG